MTDRSRSPADRRRRHRAARLPRRRRRLRHQGQRQARSGAARRPTAGERRRRVHDQPRAGGAGACCRASTSRDRAARGRAVVINSGCANACTGADGREHARRDGRRTRRARSAATRPTVLVASTGVIGVKLDIAKVERGIRRGRAGCRRRGGADAARAIMTTDPFPKEVGGRSRRRGGRHVPRRRHGQGLGHDRAADGDDARRGDDRRRGRAGAAAARAEGRGRRHVQRDHRRRRVLDQRLRVRAGQRRERRRADRARLAGCSSAACKAVCEPLAIGIVRGGEGATKLVTVRVTGAASDDEARRAARAIANSPLVKTAVHGGDPNWGRLVAVAGRRGRRSSSTTRVGADRPIELFADGTPLRRARAGGGRLSARARRSMLGSISAPAAGAVADVDVRPQRRVRANQRGVSDVSRISDRLTHHMSRRHSR